MSSHDKFDRLERLHKLFESGILTAEEYAREKYTILGEDGPGARREAAGAPPPTPPAPRPSTEARAGPGMMVAVGVVALLVVAVVVWAATRRGDRSGVNEIAAASNGSSDTAMMNGIAPATNGFGSAMANGSTTATNSTVSNLTGSVETPPPPPPVDLSAYAGAMPWTRVAGGPSFLREPKVRSAVSRVVSDRSVREAVLSEGVSSPIELRGRLVRMSGCEQHNCGSHNWVILIDRQGENAEVCYFNEAQDEYGVIWYRAGGRREMRGGTCPD